MAVKGTITVSFQMDSIRPAGFVYAIHLLTLDGKSLKPPTIVTPDRGSKCKTNQNARKAAKRMAKRLGIDVTGQ